MGTTNGSGRSLKITSVEDRKYQIELLEMATKQNIIICLPTGSGKTFIALKLTEHMLAKHYGDGTKVIFLANTVPLVNQQSEFFKDNLGDGSRVRALTGVLNIDFWSPLEWSTLFDEADVLVMSSQILFNAITHGFVTWENICLLILDECHHCKKDDIMGKIMDSYRKKALKSKEGLPKVLGLTATIVKGSATLGMMSSEIEDIQQRLCCKAVTHRNYEEVLRCSTNASIQTVYHKMMHSRGDRVCEPLTSALDMLGMVPDSTFSKNVRPESVGHGSLTSEAQLYNKKDGISAGLKRLLNDVLDVYEELGFYCAVLAASVKLILLMKQEHEHESNYGGRPNNRSKFDASSDSDDDEDAPVTEIMLIQCARTSLFVFRSILEKQMKTMFEEQSEFNAYEAFRLRKCISPKVENFLELLKSKSPTELKETEEPLCGLVFCDRRLTVLVLHWHLKDLAQHCPEFDFIKSGFVLGSNNKSNDIEEARRAATWQSQTIASLRQKNINLIIATKVLEEGLDIPACNMVVRFDGVQTYPSLIQSMGRARMKDAYFYVFIRATDKKNDDKKLDVYQRFNVKLAEELSAQAEHVGEEELQITDLPESVIPPFCPSGNPTAQITESNVIPLIHRYCAGLGMDRIAVPQPLAWWDKTDSGQFKSYVMLPRNAVVKEIIEGPPMANKMLAKKAAFMEVGKLLFNAGVFDDHLVPLSRVEVNFQCEFLSELAEEDEEDQKMTVGKIGSKKRTQWYPKSLPFNITNKGTLQPNSVCKMFMIEFHCESVGNQSSRSYMHSFERHPYVFAIVTQVDLERIPSFILRSNFGNITANLKAVKGGALFTDDQLQSLTHFQKFMAENIYNVSASWILSLKKECELLVAPVKKGVNPSIDWTLIYNLLHYKGTDCNEVTLEDFQTNFTFDEKLYADAVLIPRYKPADEIMCVEKISTLTGESPLEHGASLTYTQYFEQRWKATLLQPHAPLIAYKVVAKQRNYLTKKSDGREKSTPRRMLPHVPPELCTISPIPASIVVQGRLIPSAIHRIGRLYLAMCLKLDVGKAFGWNIFGDKASEGSSAKLYYVDEDDRTQTNGIGSSWHHVLGNGGVEIKNGKVSNNIDVVDLEYVHPFHVSSEQIQKCAMISVSAKARNQRSYMPDKFLAKCGQEGLVDIRSINFPSVDAPTDFELVKGPSMHTIMEALTLSNGNDCISLEQLEVMGDAALKLIVSSHIFCNFSNWNEGQMTTLRTKLISNQHLYRIGLQVNLGNYLSGGIFVPKESWLPPGVCIPDVVKTVIAVEELNALAFSVIPKSDLMKMTAEELIRNLHSMHQDKLSNFKTHCTLTSARIGDKCIADAMEALIGAYYLNGGVDSALRFMEWAGLKGPLPDSTSIAYSRTISFSCEKIAYSPGKQTPYNQVRYIDELQKTLGYTFNDKWLLVEAMTHPSFLKNRVTGCYERLEFIGDSILDFLVTDYIFKRTDVKNPGRVTDLRSALVNNITFGTLTIRYGFHRYILHASEMLQASISRFSDYQDKHNHEVNDPYVLLTDDDFISVAEIEVPKVLGDIFESIAGAIFVDSKLSLDAVWRVFYRLMKNEIDKFSQNVPIAPIRRLNEAYPGKVKFTDVGPSSQTGMKKVRLQITGEKITAVGKGSSKNQARRAAAKYVIAKYLN